MLKLLLTAKNSQKRLLLESARAIPLPATPSSIKPK